MDTISKPTMFAADAIPGVGMYQHARPSDLLKAVMSVDNGNLEFSKEDTERLMSRMPERLVGVKADSKGRLDFSVYKRSDFTSPTNPNGSAIKGSGVVPILVADTIMEGAMPYTSARNILDIYRVNTSTIQVPFFSARKAAKKVAPNADAVDIAETMAKALAEVHDFKMTCTLSKGLLEDAPVDVKAAVLKEMGAGMEIALDEMAVKCCIDNAYGTATSCNTADALKGLNFARAQVGQNGFRATGALISPLFEAHALNAMAVPAYNDRAQAVGENASLIKFAGLDLGVDGSTDLDWGTASDVGAVVVDRTHAAKIIMRDDLRVDEEDNITKFAINPVIVSRFTCVAPVDKDKTSINQKGAMVKVVNA